MVWGLWNFGLFCWRAETYIPWKIRRAMLIDFGRKMNLFNQPRGFQQKPAISCNPAMKKGLQMVVSKLKWMADGFYVFLKNDLMISTLLSSHCSQVMKNQLIERWCFKARSSGLCLKKIWRASSNHNEYIWYILVYITMFGRKGKGSWESRNE